LYTPGVPYDYTTFCDAKRDATYEYGFNVRRWIIANQATFLRDATVGTSWNNEETVPEEQKVIMGHEPWKNAEVGDDKCTSLSDNLLIQKDVLDSGPVAIVGRGLEAATLRVASWFPLCCASTDAQTTGTLESRSGAETWAQDVDDNRGMPARLA
jgi:hypothetical protein